MGRLFLSFASFSIITSMTAANLTAQPSAINQKADKSACSNIVALVGNVSINCSSLSPEQAVLLARIPALLKEILANQLDKNVLMDKLDEVLRATSRPNQVVNAPNGIGSVGGTLVNPVVNNFGPPAAKLTYTEETIGGAMPDAAGFYVLKVHIKTDRSIPGAVVGIEFSGPFEAIAVDKDQPELLNSGSRQLSWGGVLSNGVPIPNSLAVQVAIPSAFTPQMEIIVTVRSKTLIHVLFAAPVGQ